MVPKRRKTLTGIFQKLTVKVISPRHDAIEQLNADTIKI